MLKGARVILRPPEREDVPMLCRWINDQELNDLYLIPRFPLSLEQEHRWLDRMSTSETDRALIIETLEERRPIGVISLLNINMQHRNADLALAIFERDCWDHGYGTEAILTLLRFAFDTLNLHRVQLNVHEDNLRARRCYEKCGFVEEGVMRDLYFRRGRYTNSIRLSMLEQEFRANHARRDEPPTVRNTGG